MQRCQARLVLAAVALTLLLQLTSRKAAAVEFLPAPPAGPSWLYGTSPEAQPTTCYVWQGTVNYSDAAHTNWTGLCTITCNQAYYGNVYPTFTDGGTCTGSPGAYTVRQNYGCPGICP